MEIGEHNSKIDNDLQVSDNDLQGKDLQEGNLKDKIDQAQQLEMLAIPVIHEEVIIGKKIIC